MRNVLLTFALLLTFGMSFGQIKVVTNGNVGIGESNPQATLHVGGPIMLENVSGNNFFSGQSGDKRFNFATATTTSASDAYFSMFGTEVNGVAARSGELTFGGKYCIMKAGKAPGDFGINALRIEENGDMNLMVGEAFKQGGGSWMAISDKNLKKNINKYSIGLEAILELNPVTFEYNGLGGTTPDKEHVGLIAQEYQEVAPYAIETYTYRDEEKGVFGEEYLSINDGVIKFMLVNAIKEQQSQIEAKDVQIDALTERLAALETAVLNLSNGTTTQNVEIRDSRLGQNAPNPFTQATVISYAVPTKAQTAVMQVFDMNGQLLKSVNVANGNGQLTINAGELAAGTYSYNLVVDGAVVDTKKMVLTK